jgi:predicted transcriptional regulator
MGLSPEEREALQKAASAEDKPMAYVAQRAVVAWLKEQGWLKK